MFINSNLFSKGIPMIAGQGLSSVLEGHRRRIVEKIRNISDLDQMTDSFLENSSRVRLLSRLSCSLTG